jgi:hypothetical protein
VADDLVRDHLHFFRNFVVPAAHKPLDGINGVLRVGNRLPLGNLAHQPFPGLGNAHDRRRGSPTFLVGDYDRLSPLHHSYHRICGAQVYPYDFTHTYCFLRSSLADSGAILNIEFDESSAKIDSKT